MRSRLTFNILIAEDNPVNQKVALYMLRKLGHQADLASNGQEVLDALEKQVYDLVLMDIQMPYMNGIEVTKIIRQRWQGGPKIIAVTSFNPDICRKQCFCAGMDDFLNKPVRMNELDAAIDRNMGTGDRAAEPFLCQPFSKPSDAVSSPQFRF